MNAVKKVFWDVYKYALGQRRKKRSSSCNRELSIDRLRYYLVNDRRSILSSKDSDDVLKPKLVLCETTMYITGPFTFEDQTPKYSICNRSSLRRMVYEMLERMHQFSMKIMTGA